MLPDLGNPCRKILGVASHEALQLGAVVRREDSELSLGFRVP